MPNHAMVSSMKSIGIFGFGCLVGELSVELRARHCLDIPMVLFELNGYVQICAAPLLFARVPVDEL